MKKIRLTESDLHNIVRNSVKRILMEQEEGTFNLSNEEMEELKNFLYNMIEIVGYEEKYSFEEEVHFEGNKDYFAIVTGKYDLGIPYSWMSRSYEPGDEIPTGEIESVEIVFTKDCSCVNISQSDLIKLDKCFGEMLCELKDKYYEE